MFNGLALLLAGVVFYGFAYFFYGRFIERLFGMDADAPTPAHTRRDGVDYMPAPRMVLFGHHFASIAGAGPIVGPIMASYYGWVPVVCWLLFGCIFVGAVHDFASLSISVRSEGRGIASVIDDFVGRFGRTLFLLFSLFTLVIVVAVFTNMVVGTFVPTPAVATSSLLFIAMSPVFGWLVYRRGVPLALASCIFVPLVFLTIWIGQRFPLDLCALFGLSQAAAGKVWMVVLLVYVAVASVLPVWLLLQPRDYLNSWLLYAMLIFGLVGICIARPGIALPAYAGFHAPDFGGKPGVLFPMLFVTIACGACSGFHSVVASGTTSKQLDRMLDARPVAYGGMLLEGVLGFVALISVATLGGDELAKRIHEGGWTAPMLFADGLAAFGERLGLNREVGSKFIGLAVSAFLLTTLDTATRIARFMWQELFRPGISDASDTQSTGAKSAPQPAWATLLSNKYLATFAVIAAVSSMVFFDARRTWPIFGAANQLLAMLALLVATLWLIRHRPRLCWVTLVPMVWMLAVSTSGLFMLAKGEFGKADGNLQLAVFSTVLLALSALLLVLSVLSIRREFRRKKA